MINYPRRFLFFFIVLTPFIILLISQYVGYLEKSHLNILMCTTNQTKVSLSILSSHNVTTTTTGKTSFENLQLNLPHCQIPKVPLYSHHYRPIELNFETCESEVKFSTLKKEVIQLEGFGVGSKCCVSEIIRPYKLSSDTFEIGKCIPFKKSTTTMNVSGKEFIKVICTKYQKIKKSKKLKLMTNNNFYASVIPSANYLKEKIKYWKKKEEIPVNVLVLVLDSTTRTDAFRQLPKTMNYLLNELNFIDFKGFHSLGEPTIVNAIPLLFGIPISEFFGKIKMKWIDTWDNLPFIWNEFNQFSFATSYIEDIPSIGTFNYWGQTGFTYKPTDFYLRPITLANLINNKPECVGKTVIEKFILDYQFEMLKKMNGIIPLFSMPWLSWPQHDYLDSLAKLENSILNFFQNIKNTTGFIENTVVFIMGDHGFRSGKYAKSHEGLLERRLPLFLIRLPSKLISKHPKFANRIKENSNRITSHYDVYKTLLHLAQYSTPKIKSVLNKTTQKIQRKFGKSLFEFIPENRTCSDAGIPINNCACNLPSPSPDWSVKVPSIMELKTSFDVESIN